MSFAIDLEAFAKKTQAKLDQVVRKVVVDMTGEMVHMNPVDTGHSRSNYFWGVQRVSEIDSTMDKTGAPSVRRAVGFAATLRAGGVFYLTNNLPYIMALEYGHSKQAPAGMARITVARFQKIVDRAVQVVR